MKTFVKVIMTGLVLWGNMMLKNAQQINYCEYYIDNDPGLGQGNAIAVSADTLVEISAQLNISSLSRGSHRLVLRCRDDSGRWSLLQTRSFYVNISEPAASQLVAAEYWTGADPGQGNGSSIAITVDSVVILQTTLAPVVGTKQLSFRFRSNNGIWSQPYSRTYSAIIPEAPSNQLLSLEYFFDDNTGTKQTVTVAADAVVDTSFNLSIASLPTGTHRINVALRDDAGKKSPVSIRWFNSLPPEPVDSIAQFAIYLDDSLHTHGAAMQQAIVSATIFNDTLRLNLSQIAGDYPIYVAGISRSGKYGFPSKIKYYTACDVLPQAGFTVDSTVYVNLPFKVRNTTQYGDTATTYLWSYMEGSNELTSSKVEPIFVLSSLNTYNIQLIAKNVGKCADTVMQAVTPSEISGCLGDFVYDNDNGRTFNFYNVSVASTGRRWDFGDGILSDLRNTSHTFKADGQYRVCMTNYEATTKCLKKVCKDVVVEPVKCKSVFSYSVDTNNSNMLHFTDQSQDMDEYLWDFGDGWTSKQQHPSHTYSEVGTYRVCHAIKSTVLGCYQQSCQNIIVGAPATTPFNAFFVFYVDHSAKKVYLSNNSTPVADTYYWTFGDGTFAATEDAEHQYATNGAYEVCLQVADSTTKQSDRHCETVLVGDTLCKITASFSAFVDTARKVVFVNQSKGDNLQYFWNYGDGATSTAFQPEHTYVQNGRYLVSLAVGNASCFDYTSAYVEVGTAPCKADFAYQYLPGSGEMSFYNQSAGSNNAYFWNFDDGNYSFDTNPTHAYAQQGSYRVSLTVTNTTNGCQDIQTQQVQAGDANCQAQFSYFVDSLQRTVRFSNLSTGSYNNLLWSFGDGKFSTQKDPSHRYAAAGYFKVGLTIMNTSNGCTDYYEEPVLVGNSLNDCEADFSYVPQSGTRTVKFFDQSQGNIIGYLWNFGDGTY
ncbi:MAG: PKD domain-containing protein, partial [Bacteroidales bacterium]